MRKNRIAIKILCCMITCIFMGVDLGMCAVRYGDAKTVRTQQIATFQQASDVGLLVESINSEVMGAISISMIEQLLKKIQKPFFETVDNIVGDKKTRLCIYSSRLLALILSEYFHISISDQGENYIKVMAVLYDDSIYHHTIVLCLHGKQYLVDATLNQFSDLHIESQTFIVQAYDVGMKQCKFERVEDAAYRRLERFGEKQDRMKEILQKRMRAPSDLTDEETYIVTFTLRDIIDLLDRKAKQPRLVGAGVDFGNSPENGKVYDEAHAIVMGVVAVGEDENREMQKWATVPYVHVTAETFDTIINDIEAKRNKALDSRARAAIERFREPIKQLDHIYNAVIATTDNGVFPGVCYEAARVTSDVLSQYGIGHRVVSYLTNVENGPRIQNAVIVKIAGEEYVLDMANEATSKVHTGIVLVPLRYIQSLQSSDSLYPLFSFYNQKPYVEVVVDREGAISQMTMRTLSDNPVPVLTVKNPIRCEWGLLTEEGHVRAYAVLSNTEYGEYGVIVDTAHDMSRASVTFGSILDPDQSPLFFVQDVTFKATLNVNQQERFLVDNKEKSISFFNGKREAVLPDAFRYFRDDSKNLMARMSSLELLGGKLFKKSDGEAYVQWLNSVQKSDMRDDNEVEIGDLNDIVLQKHSEKNNEYVDLNIREIKQAAMITKVEELNNEYVIRSELVDTVDGADIYEVSIKERGTGADLDPIVVFYVFNEQKIIYCESFFPKFPEEERRGKGRALFQYLFSQPEYSGFTFITAAEPKFKQALFTLQEQLGYDLVSLSATPVRFSVLQANSIAAAAHNQDLVRIWQERQINMCVMLPDCKQDPDARFQPLSGAEQDMVYERYVRDIAGMNDAYRASFRDALPYAVRDTDDGDAIYFVLDALKHQDRYDELSDLLRYEKLVCFLLGDVSNVSAVKEVQRGDINMAVPFWASTVHVVRAAFDTDYMPVQGSASYESSVISWIFMRQHDVELDAPRNVYIDPESNTVVSYDHAAALRDIYLDLEYFVTRSDWLTRDTLEKCNRSYMINAIVDIMKLSGEHIKEAIADAGFNNADATRLYATISALRNNLASDVDYVVSKVLGADLKIEAEVMRQIQPEMGNTQEAVKFKKLSVEERTVLYEKYVDAIAGLGRDAREGFKNALKHTVMDTKNQKIYFVLDAIKQERNSEDYQKELYNERLAYGLLGDMFNICEVKEVPSRLVEMDGNKSLTVTLSRAAFEHAKTPVQSRGSYEGIVVSWIFLQQHDANLRHQGNVYYDDTSGVFVAYDHGGAITSGWSDFETFLDEAWWLDEESFGLSQREDVIESVVKIMSMSDGQIREAAKNAGLVAGKETEIVDMLIQRRDLLAERMDYIALSLTGDDWGIEKAVRERLRGGDSFEDMSKMLQSA